MRSLIIGCLLLIFSTAAQSQLLRLGDTDFRRADSVAALYPKHSLRNLRMLTDKLIKPLPSSEEKFRAIYRWVCSNIAYDYSLFQKNKRKKDDLTGDGLVDWNRQFSIRVFKTLVEKQRTVCTGYAYLVREMATIAGIPCVIVDGYGRSSEANIGGTGNVNHSWNAVQLYGKWYLFDPTWSSGSYDPMKEEYIQKFNPSYFLAAPEIFVRNHFPIDSSWTLLREKKTLDEFLNGPLIYTGAFAHNVEPLLPAKFDLTVVKGNTIMFEFSGKNKPVGKAELVITGPGGPKTISKLLTQDLSGRCALAQPFTSKGTYVVHLVLDGDFIFTYRVKVV